MLIVWNVRGPNTPRIGAAIPIVLPVPAKFTTPVLVKAVPANCNTAVAEGENVIVPLLVIVPLFVNPALNLCE